MTIVAGIICKQFIVVGADSRLTNAVDGSIINADKISIVNFGADQVLVGQSGLSQVSSKIVRYVKKRSADIQITDGEEVINVFEDAIRSAKRGLTKPQLDHIQKYGVVLMVAFYVNGRPHLYTSQIATVGLLEQASSHWAVTGCADMLAGYFLTELSQPHAVDELQLSTLVYTLMKVKEHNAYCGGPTVIKYLTTFRTGLDSPPVAKATAIDPGFILKIEQMLKSVDESSKDARNRAILAGLRQVSEEFSKTNWRAK